LTGDAFENGAIGSAEVTPRRNFRREPRSCGDQYDIRFNVGDVGNYLDVDPLVIECIQQIDAHAEQSMFICQCATPNQQKLIGGL
jgi:hypothetical protein